MNQIKSEKRIKERKKVGLDPTTSDIKDSSKDPTVTYVSHPKIPSKSELNDKMRANNVKYL